MFRVVFGTENAAFDDVPNIEIGRILRDVAERIEDGSENGVIVDLNGNAVGTFHLNADPA